MSSQTKHSEQNKPAATPEPAKQEEWISPEVTKIDLEEAMISS